MPRVFSTPMPTTPTTVRQLSLTCEFDEYSDAQIQPFLDEAALHQNRAAWDVDPDRPRHDQGLALLAAHLITLAVRGGGGGKPAKGTITSERLGPASRSYATPGAATAGLEALRLAETGYGMRWAALLDSLPLTPMSVYDGVTGNPDW